MAVVLAAPLFTGCLLDGGKAGEPLEPG